MLDVKKKWSLFPHNSLRNSFTHHFSTWFLKGRETGTRGTIGITDDTSEHCVLISVVWRGWEAYGSWVCVCVGLCVAVTSVPAAHRLLWWSWHLCASADVISARYIALALYLVLPFSGLTQNTYFPVVMRITVEALWISSSHLLSVRMGNPFHREEMESGRSHKRSHGSGEVPCHVVTKWRPDLLEKMAVKAPQSKSKVPHCLPAFFITWN